MEFDLLASWMNGIPMDTGLDGRFVRGSCASFVDSSDGVKDDSN